MKRPIITLALCLTLTACAQGPGFRGPGLPPKANPSAVIAAELAFARLAQEKGQWSAFRATAASDAVMFVPQRVRAQDWLKGRADPATAVRWAPTAVWSSCDGSYAVTRGNWQSANASGGFVTVWQRQGDPKRAPRPGEKVEYKWVLDMSVTTEHGTASSETIDAKVAACSMPPPRMSEGMMPATPNDRVHGYASDGSLRWTSEVRPDFSRRIEVESWNGTRYETVLALDGRDVE